MEEEVLRENLLEFLQQGPAHATVKEILSDIQPNNRHKRPAGGLHTIWEELEHLRIAQEDILRYTIDSAWASPPWPEGYWPVKDIEPNEKQWQEFLDLFFSDLHETIKLVKNEQIDLTSSIPHGEGRTYLREILLIIDHNAYHLGKIVQLRKMLGNWSC